MIGPNTAAPTGPKKIDFYSGYRDSTKGATLKALQQRRADLQGQVEAAMKPRDIDSMWQGGAQIANVIGSSIREGRAANQEASGRARYAELLAGGLAPDEIGEAMGLDPETTMKYQQNTWDTEAETRKHGYDVDAAVQRQKDAMALQENQQTFQSGQTEDSQAHALELQKQSQEAQRVLQDARATDEEKRRAQEVVDRAKEAETLVNTNKVAADQAAERTATQSEHDAALQDPRAKLALSLKEGIISQDEYKTGLDAINAEAAKKTIPAGLDELNRKTANEALEWKTIGASTAASNQANIDEAIKTLEQPGIMGQFGDDIGLGKTGAVAGMLPPGLGSVLNPSGEKASAAVQTAVQSSLKLILGSQFAMTEGEQLLKRAFDKSMPPDENVRRAKMIKAQLQQAAEAKEQFVKYYFDHNYNMDGYQGPNLQQIQQDFDAKVRADLDAADAGAGGDTAAPAADGAPTQRSDDDLLNQYRQR